MYRKLIAATLFLSGLGLATPETEACLFKHCRLRRQVVCAPSAQAQVQVQPQAQAPVYGGVPQQVFTVQDQVNFLSNIVIQGQQFTDPNTGGTVVIPRQPTQ